MRKIKFISSLFLAFILLISCKQQQARMPISHSSGEFLKASVERNKKLIKGEESKIDSIIKSNPEIKYIASQKGYWYYYETKSDRDTIHPKKGDVACFDYEIKDLDGNVIYSQLELKPQN
jgi:gliding motility-associated peptidyl-prolyl isomerase